jgi:hypothetical protein
MDGGSADHAGAVICRLAGDPTFLKIAKLQAATRPSTFGGT